MKFFFTSLLLLTTSVGFSQVYFLKNDGRRVNVRDSADYIRAINKSDSAATIYYVGEFYLNGARKFLGKSSSVNPLKYEGECITYYPTGIKQSLTYYKNNLRTGVETLYYPNGKLYASLKHSDKAIPERENSDDKQTEAYNDSLRNVFIKNNSRYFVNADDTFPDVEEEGSAKDGKKDGVWKGELKNRHITFTENYSNGKLISGTATSEDGKTSTYTSSRRMPPQFKGGIEAFGLFLSQNIIYPIPARKKGTQGRVILTFVVGKNGELSNIKVSKSVSPLIDSEAMRVLRLSPKWVPGTEFGIPSSVTYSVPISFSLGN